jgi:hypothetical protein
MDLKALARLPIVYIIIASYNCYTLIVGYIKLQSYYWLEAFWYNIILMTQLAYNW